VRGTCVFWDDLRPHAGTPLKPPLHALHAYDSAWLNPKFTLPDAVRTMLLHKRQMHETARQEQRAAEKAAALAQHLGHSVNGTHSISRSSASCRVRLTSFVVRTNPVELAQEVTWNRISCKPYMSYVLYVSIIVTCATYLSVTRYIASSAL
jgi:hypothetical protein